MKPRSQQRTGARAGPLASTVMSPEGASFSPSGVPQHNGFGSYARYRKDVVNWEAVQDALLAAGEPHSRKAYPKTVRALLLRQNLSGNPASIAQTVPDSQLATMHGVEKLLSTLDPISVERQAEKRFIAHGELLRCRRTGSVDGFITAFQARKAMFMAEYFGGGVAQLPQELEEVLAYTMIANSEIGGAAQAQVLMYALKGKAPGELLTVEDAAQGLHLVGFGQAHAGRELKQVGSLLGDQNRTDGKKERLKEMKRKTKCKVCNQKGHWAGDTECAGVSEGFLGEDKYASSIYSLVSSHSATHNPLLTTPQLSLLSACKNMPIQAVNTTGPQVIQDTGSPLSIGGETELKRLAEKAGSHFNLEPKRKNDPDRHRFGISGPAAPIEGRFNVMLNDYPVSFLVRKSPCPILLGADVLDLCTIDGPGNQIRTKEGNLLCHTQGLQSGHKLCIFNSVSSFLSIQEYVDKGRRIHARTHATADQIAMLMVRAGEASQEEADRGAEALSKIVQRCGPCFRTTLPTHQAKVSVTPIFLNFNERVGVDIVYLRKVPFLHICDTATGYSEIGCAGGKRGQKALARVFETQWVYRHGAPQVAMADGEFEGGTAWLKMLETHGIQPAKLPSRHSRKNGITERKHREIRKFFERLCEPVEGFNEIVEKATIASHLANCQSGSRLASSFELVRGYAPHIPGGIPLPEEVRRADERRRARQKLLRLKHSKAIKFKTNYQVGDRVFVHIAEGKARNWLEARVQAITDGGIAIGSSRAKRHIAFEDVMAERELVDDIGADVVQDGEEGQDAVEQPEEDQEELPSFGDAPLEDNADFVPRAAESNNDGLPMEAAIPEELALKRATEGATGLIVEETSTGMEPVTSESSQQAITEAKENAISHEETSFEDSTGTEKRVRPLQEGSDSEEQEIKRRHFAAAGNVDTSPNELVTNDKEDEDQRAHLKPMPDDTGDFGKANSAHIHDIKRVRRDRKRKTPETPVRASSRVRRRTQRLIEIYLGEHDYAARVEEMFGTNPFSYNKAMNCGLQSNIFEVALTRELQVWKGAYEEVDVSQIPSGANVIGCHVLFNIKPAAGNKQRRLKARLVLHGHRDKERSMVRGDTPVPNSNAQRLVASICVAMGWQAFNGDVEGACLKSGPAPRLIFVRLPPFLEARRCTLWKLLKMPYGLRDAGRQWLKCSDGELRNMGLRQSLFFPQIFFSPSRNLLLAKYVDDIFGCGTKEAVTTFLVQFEKRFKLGTRVLAPEIMRFVGWNVETTSDRITLNQRDYAPEIEALEVPKDKAAVVDKDHKDYLKLCGKLNWLGHRTSPVAAFAASFFFLQRAAHLSVHDLRLANGVLKECKRQPNCLSFKKVLNRPCRGEDFAHMWEKAVIEVFTDAGFPHGKELPHAQLGIAIGLTWKSRISVSHLVEWGSRRMRKVVYSTPHAELLAITQGYAAAKLIQAFFYEFAQVKVPIHAFTDSKGMQANLTTSSCDIEKFLRLDAALIRHELESRELQQLTWIRGNRNPADCLTKRVTGTGQVILRNWIEESALSHFQESGTKGGRVETVTATPSSRPESRQEL